MKFIKVLLTALIFSVSMHAIADNAKPVKTLNDDESIEFTDAIGKGDMKTIKKFMNSGVDVNAPYFAWPPLLMAAAKGQFEAVKYFTELGGAIDYVHPLTKWSAFMHAAYDGHPEMVKYLASKGADINKKGKGDISIIRLVREKGDDKMVELLTSLGVKDDGCKEERCF